MRKLTFTLAAAACALIVGACQDTTDPVALAGSGGSGNDTQCVGALTGTFDNVVVPSGATCNLNNSTVRGNVKALENSSLLMVNNLVRGNVDGDKATLVQVNGGTVHGSIHIIEAHNPATSALVSAVVIGTTLPEGNIQIEKGRDPVGDFLVTGTTLNKGNIKAEENRSAVFVGQIQNNTVAQDVQVFKNIQGFNIVAGNVIGENLQCKENSTPFTGAPNSVGGNAEDQCAASGTTSATASASALPDLSEFPVRR